VRISWDEGLESMARWRGEVPGIGLEEEEEEGLTR